MVEGFVVKLVFECKIPNVVADVVYVEGSKTVKIPEPSPVMGEPAHGFERVNGVRVEVFKRVV